MRNIFIIISFTLIYTSFGQTQLEFIPTIETQKISIGEEYTSQNTTYKITKLLFYVGTNDNGKLNYNLLDFPKKTSITLNEKPHQNIQLNIGVDSLTNDNGIGPNDLDPMKGMYWAWQTGYINIKIEGYIIVPSSNKKQHFEYHLGGFRTPSQNAVTLNIAYPKNNKVYISIDQWLRDIDAIKNPKVMSPGVNSNNLTKQFTKCFYTK